MCARIYREDSGSRPSLMHVDEGVLTTNNTQYPRTLTFSLFLSYIYLYRRYDVACEQLWLGTADHLCFRGQLKVACDLPLDWWSYSWCLITFSDSVVMLIDGFLAITAVLEPHRLFLPAGSPCPPSVVAGDVLLPTEGATTLCLLQKMKNSLALWQLNASS